METEAKTNHHYYLSSSDKLNEFNTPTDFVVRNPQIKQATSYRILSVNIPHTYYNINSHNNTLTIFKLGDTQDRSLTLEPGNYNITELLTALKTGMDSLGGPTQTYTLTSSDITYKITITQNSSTFAIRASSTLNEVIGFSQSSDTLQSIAHIAPRIYDLQYTKTIKINSTALTSFGTLVQSSDSRGGLLATINVTNQFGENIRHKFNHLHYNYESRFERDYDITLLDDKNRLLGGDTGLNDSNMNMHLIFHTRRSNNNTHNSRTDPRSFQNSGYGDIYN